MSDQQLSAFAEHFPRAKKRFGQHFLKDRNIVIKILDALELEANDAIVEIGPGPGTLTIPLHSRGIGGPIEVVEFDKDMVEHLQTIAWDPPIKVVQGDFMDIPLNELFATPKKVLSNLPYNVSVPITTRLLRVYRQIPVMVLMFQKEVAMRVRATPGNKNYGGVSVAVQMFYTCDQFFDVGPGAFSPPPKVVSQVVRLRRRQKSLIEPEDLDRLEEILKHLFSLRRKMIHVGLKKWRGGWVSPETLLKGLNDIGIDPKLRPENLSVPDYARWIQAIKGRLSC